MAKVKMDTKVPVAPDALWHSIGQFSALNAWHPAVEKSESNGEEKGSVRTLGLVGGGSLVERLDDNDPKRRSYTYSILSGPLPVANYVSQLHVLDNGDGTSTVEWSSDFQPKDATENDAVKTIQGVYQAGFDNLRKMFGG